MSTTAMYVTLAGLVGVVLYFTAFNPCLAIDEAPPQQSDGPTATAQNENVSKKISAGCGSSCCATKSPAINYRLSSKQDQNLSCTLSGKDLKQRVELTQQVLIDKAEKIVELDNGYRFIYVGYDDAFVRALTEWVITERKCCSFFKFAITVDSNGPLVFQLTGPAGAKEIMDRFVKLKDAEER